jgi:hypothetical protein
MINCRQIIDSAFARSTFNDPGKLATDKELVGVIDRYMRRLYADAAKENPEYFGDLATVTPSSGRWMQPASAEVVNRIETMTGTRVAITPFADREAEAAPRVYRYGRFYRTVGGTGDPQATDPLVFFYAIGHPQLNPDQPPTHAANQLHETFPEQFMDLPVLRVARYLAVKDGRGGEVEAMIGEEGELLEIFYQHLANQDAGMVSRFRHRPRQVGPRKIPFAQQGG